MRSQEQHLEGTEASGAEPQPWIGPGSAPLWRSQLDQTLLHRRPALPAEVRTKSKLWGTPLGTREIFPVRAAAEAPARGSSERHAPNWASAPSRSAGLSPREWDVIALIITGRSNRVIATLLGISPNTVHKHVTTILDKLSARSRSQATAVVLGLQELERDRRGG